MTRLALVVAGVALVAAVAPALAADHTITALGNNRFDRPNLTIAAGDRVIFANASGNHNFAFSDGQSYPAPTGVPSDDDRWDEPPSRTFDTPGTYPYVCVVHDDQGMTGTIIVTAVEPTPTPQPSPDPTPTPTPSPGGGGTTPAGAQPVRVHTLALARGTFCARCKRPGVRLRIDLSAPARVTGVLKRRAKRFGRVDFGTVAAGPRTLRLRRTTAGRRLVAGRYSLALSVDAVAAKTLRFRVR
jgi:plastocyanin